MFWQDVSLALSGNPLLLAKHFSGWVRAGSTTEQVEFLISSSSPSDFRYDGSTGQFFHKKDIDLKIIVDRSESNTETFQEHGWKLFPTQSDIPSKCTFIIAGPLVRNMLFVSVDGGRYLLPAPKSPRNLKITPFQFHVGRIVASAPGHYDYDSGIQWAHFRVEVNSSES